MPETTAPTRSFKAFAVVEALRNGSADIRGALVPFFHPLLAYANGQSFDPIRIAAEANDAYAWNITGDIVEGLVPAFLDQGWLHAIEKSDQAALYRVTCHLPDGTFHSNLPEDLIELANEFFSFVDQISPLSAVQRSPDQLLDSLLRWIIALEVFSEEELKRQAVKSSEGRISIHEANLSRVGIPSDEVYLCARFSRHLADAGSHLVSVLAALARIGLLTEAAQDFAKPVTAVQETKLAIYLDAPVAMDFLDISGTSASDNIRPILERLRGIGASIRIFDNSVEEIRHNLVAMFRRPEPLRTGPTANAIRRRQAMEAFVREVAARPDKALTRLGVQIVTRGLDQFPGDHKHFTEDDFRNLYGEIGWHIDERPRTHDATVVTNILRMRRGVESADLFETGHVLVTKNGLFPGMAKRLAIRSGKLGQYSIGPVIHQRQLATAVWLRAGLGSQTDNELPLRYLLASCERVLQLRPDVIDKVRLQARSRGKESAEQLDLLLTVDRSTQVLMDRTLNVASVVTAENFEDVIESMKESLIEERVASYNKEIKDLKKSSKEEIKRIRSESEQNVDAHRIAEEKAREEQRISNERLEELNKEDRIAINALMERINNSLSRRRKIASRTISAITLVADSLAVIVSYMYPSVTANILAVLLTLVLIGHVSGLISKFLPYGNVSTEHAYALLWEEAERRGLTLKLQRIPVTYNGELFEIEA